MQLYGKSLLGLACVPLYSLILIWHKQLDWQQNSQLQSAWPTKVLLAFMNARAALSQPTELSALFPSTPPGLDHQQRSTEAITWHLQVISAGSGTASSAWTQPTWSAHLQTALHGCGTWPLGRPSGCTLGMSKPLCAALSMTRLWRAAMRSEDRKCSARLDECAAISKPEGQLCVRW